MYIHSQHPKNPEPPTLYMRVDLNAFLGKRFRVPEAIEIVLSLDRNPPTPYP